MSQAWLAERGVDSPRLDAELLLAHALRETRLRLYLDMDRPLTPAELEAFRPLLARRGKREPVAYIVGEKEFYGLTFEVTPAVLVPRPDTEIVVEEVLQRIPKDAACTIVDVCTGSGAIAIAIASERPLADLVATDISEDALAVAARNIERHQLGGRVTLRSGDLLEPVHELRNVAAVVANPPYVRAEARTELAPEVLDHEPALALFGEGVEALGHHARILEHAGQMLAPDGFVVMEAGYDQQVGLRALGAPTLGPAHIFRDLGDRVRGAIWQKRSDHA